MVRKTRLFAILFLFCAVVLEAADINLSISSQYSEIGVGEPFDITIKISGNTANLPSVSVNGFKGFQIVSTANSQNFNFINGKVSVEKDYTYTLIARKTGQYKIGPFSIKYEGKQIESNTLTINVKKGFRHKKQSQQSSQAMSQFNFNFGMPNIAGQRENNSAYVLRFVSNLNKKKVFKGEELILTYKIIRNVSFSANPDIDFPDFKGFWKEDLEEKKPYYITQDGNRYVVNEISFALFPTKTGRIVIPSSKLSGYVNTFFIDPFSGGDEKVVRKTKPLYIDVLPINKDTTGFSGAVGEFSVSDSLVSDTINAGEPLIRKITISGNGNLPLIQKPYTTYPQSFRVFNSKVEQNINRNNGISGSITFKEMIIPEKGGIYWIPGITFKYFDAKLDEMKTVKTDSLRLFVKNITSPAQSNSSISSDDNLKLAENQVSEDSLNRYLLYIYFLSIIVLVFVILVLILRRTGVRLSIIDRGVGKIAYSKFTANLKRYEINGEYKKAIEEIKKFYMAKRGFGPDFKKECDKLLFKPTELTREEYTAFKNRFNIH